VSKKTGMVVKRTGQLFWKNGVALVFQTPRLKPRDEDALSSLWLAVTVLGWRQPPL